jgi:hypothetical protein
MVPNPFRSPLSRFALVPLFAVGLALVALADPQAPPTRDGLTPQSLQEPAPVRPGFLQAPRETLSPRLLEIRDLLEGRDLQLRDLTARYRSATDDAEALRIQREIHDLKAGTELALLGIQLRHARQEGNHEAVARLEATLQRVEAGPQYQPAPARVRPVADR